MQLRFIPAEDFERLIVVFSGVHGSRDESNWDLAFEATFKKCQISPGHAEFFQEDIDAMKIKNLNRRIRQHWKC